MKNKSAGNEGILVNDEGIHVNVKEIGTDYMQKLSNKNLTNNKIYN